MKKRKPMADEQWSEFAEALHAACEENGAVRAAGDCYCPLGALLDGFDARRPSGDEAHSVLQHFGLSFDDVDDFILGFDGAASWEATGGPGFTLGLQFREAYP